MTASASYPRVYREKIWGALGAAIFIVLLLWLKTLSAGTGILYAIGALFLLMMVNLFVTRIVLYPGHIESINLIGRRSMARADIDRLEIRETKVKSRTVKKYYLIPKNEGQLPLMVPGNIKMDEAWFEWMAPIREEIVPPIEQAVSGATGVGLLILALCLGLLITPIVHSEWKFYFDLIHLSLPWLVCLYLFTSDRFRDPAQRMWLPVLGMITMMPAIYLVVIGSMSGAFVVGADMWMLIAASIGMGLFSLLLMRWSPIDSFALTRDWPITLVALAGFYGYGAALTINQLFDDSQPRTLPVSIAQKYVTTGKGAGSFFKIAPWENETEARSYRPSQATYNRLAVGDNVCASLHPGALGMRWYQLSDSCPK